VPSGNSYFTPVAMGCVGDDITDDTVCLQLASNAASVAGVPLFFDGSHLYHITSPITCQGFCDFEGFAPVGNDGLSNAQNCVSGLETTSNINGLVLSGEKAIVRNMCLQMAAAGNTASAGAAIMLGGSDQQHDIIEGNTIFRPYEGISFGGSGGEVRESYAGHNVIRDCAWYCLTVGRGTIHGETAGITLTDNRISCVDPSTTAVGFALFDGAVKWDGTNIGPNNCPINSEIVPGVNQDVNGQFTGTMGDSAGTHGGSSPKELYIEPQDVSATINWLEFSNIWVSSVQPNDTDVYIGNSHGASCANIGFTGGAFHGYGNQTNVINIQGCYNITFNGAQIDSWLTGTVTNGMLIGNGVDNQPVHIAITGNHFGATQGGAMTNGINIHLGASAYLNPDYVTIGDNEMGVVANPIVTNAQNNIYGMQWAIANNEGVDDVCPTVASASSLSLPGAYSCYHVTGTTTVTTINPAWIDRKVTLISDDGFTLSAAGGSPGICSGSGTLVLLPYAAAYMTFGSNCWLHQ
jgi:hypothetical protein